MWTKDLKHHLPELAGTCYCIATADHHLSDVEMHDIAQNIATFAERDVGVDEVESLLVEALVEIKRTGREHFVSDLGARVASPAGRTQLLGAAASTMLADRVIKPEERAQFFEVAHGLGIDKTEAEFILRSVAAPLAAHAVH